MFGRDGPHAAYVAFQVTNTSGGTLTDLSGTLGDPSAFAGFAFAGGQPATILIGTLTAGQSRTFYWFIEYPCHTAAVISANLTVTVSDSNPGTVALTNTVTAISSISANAGGVLLSSLLGPGFVVGQVIPLDITYAFGNVQVGDVFIFQPAGNTDFDTSCFQLIRAEVLASDITVITVGTQDQLFFTSTVSQGGSGNEVQVRYEFLNKCAAASTTADPYAAQTSGAAGLKYTGNFGDGAFTTTIPPATNALTIAKTVSPTSLMSGAGGTVEYTVTLTNSSAFVVFVTRIQDVLPALFSYDALDVASGVTASNSGTLPANGATGAIEWLGNAPPFNAYEIPASGSLSLIYTATVDPMTPDGLYVNSASSFMDQVQTGPDTATVVVGMPVADVSVTKDDGVTSAVPGQSLTYTIVATNNGPTDDPSVSLTDTFPSDLTCTFTSAAAGGATGNTASGMGNLAETLSMPPGGSVTYTVMCTIDSAATGTLSNTATVTGSVTDPSPGNNSATDADTVLAPMADVSVTKDDGVTSAVPGQSLTYTIVATNNGPTDDPSVSLTDTFPSDLTCTFTSAAAGGATGNTASGMGNLAETLSMPPGGSVTYTVMCTIDSAATGTLSNTATVTGSVTDPSPGNNSATDADTVLAPMADVSVTKDDGVTSAVPGQSLTYTIVATNNGPTDDPSVSLTDTFPSDLTCTFTSAAAGGATGNTASGMGNLAETLSMPPGGSVTYTVMCTIDSAATGTLSNTATVTGSVTDPSPGNNSATDADTVLAPMADVSVTKDDGVTSAVPGQSLTYTIVATNNGPTDNPSVSLTDTFPSDLTCTFTSAAAGGATGNTASGMGNLAETLSMPPGGSVTYTVMCTIDSAATGTLSNTATVTGSVTDPSPGNNSATDADTVLAPMADVSVTKTDGVTSAAPGGTLTYTIVASNAGPSDDPSVTLNDTFPADLTCTFTSVAAGGATGNTAAGAGNLSETLSMPVGSSVTYTVMCTIDSMATGTLSNTATVSSSVTDPGAGNDSATDGDTEIVPETDLAIVKDDAGAEFVPGTNITYTMTVTNNGPSDSSGGTITDVLPAGVTFVSSPSGCTEAGGTVSCPVPALTSGANVVLTIILMVDPGQTATIINTATVAANETDPTPANDSDSEPTPLLGSESDLSITKEASGNLVQPGTNLTYTLTVTNNGPSDSSGGTVTDVLPAGLTFVSSASGCTEMGGTVTCPFGAIPNGSSVALTFVVMVDSEQVDPISNTATVSGNESDPDSSNNSATAGAVSVGVSAIPLLSEWGILLLTALLALLACWKLQAVDLTRGPGKQDPGDRRR